MSIFNIKKQDWQRIIKNARIKAGVKQSDVAEAVGVAQASYSRFENGKTELNFTTVLAIINYLKPSDYMTSNSKLEALKDNFWEVRYRLSQPDGTSSYWAVVDRFSMVGLGLMVIVGSGATPEEAIKKAKINKKAKTFETTETIGLW